jgi:hypothetical protein
VQCVRRWLLRLSRRVALLASGQWPTACRRHRTLRASTSSRTDIKTTRLLWINAARRAFLDERKSYRPVLGVPPFGQGPGDITVFAAICEMIRKLNHMLLVGRYYGTQEDLGTVCILRSFMEDAVAIARMATDDVSVSCQSHYQLHGTLLALL